MENRANEDFFQKSFLSLKRQEVCYFCAQSGEGSQTLALKFIFRNSFLLFLCVRVCPAVIAHPPFSPVTRFVMFSTNPRSSVFLCDQI